MHLSNIDLRKDSDLDYIKDTSFNNKRENNSVLK